MDDAIDTIRAFSRFYTKRIGALDARFLESDLSLPEARLLFEIARADRPVAADLQATLGMDAGYVSRILRRFETQGWIDRERGAGDRRRRPIRLTVEGRAVFDMIDARQRADVVAMLDGLEPIERSDLVTALRSARRLLEGQRPKSFTIRAFRAGDMGMIAARQSILYAQSHGWTRRLEVIEGEVTTAFLRDFKPGREQCWVAEVDGLMAGSIFLTDEGGGLARLRLLYVEPFARGMGIGRALVAACVGFARDVGYETITLWTHTILDSARRLYAAKGFVLTETAMHEEFGDPVQGETWRLDLRRKPSDP